MKAFVQGFAFGLLLFILVFVLAGCAHNETKPAPILSGVTSIEPQLVPVPVPCLTADKIPKPPASWMAGRTGWHAEVAAALDLRELDLYMIESQSRMWGCVKSFEEEKSK